MSNKCCLSNKNNKVDRFIEISILCFLYEKKCHGYGIMDRLIALDVIDGEINISTIYRILQRLEKEEAVISEWEESDQGPKKKVYSITSMGKMQLKEWIKLLKERKKRIDIIINIFEN